MHCHFYSSSIFRYGLTDFFIFNRARFNKDEWKQYKVKRFKAALTPLIYRNINEYKQMYSHRYIVAAKTSQERS